MGFRLSEVLANKFPPVSGKPWFGQPLGSHLPIHPEEMENDFDSPFFPCSITLYDLDDAKESFCLELRNIPFSIPVEKILGEMNGWTDRGQNHWTARVRVRASSFRSLRRLANAIGKACDDAPRTANSLEKLADRIGAGRHLH